MSHVYFPNSALISVIAVAHGGKGLEVGMIGRHAFVGASSAVRSRSPTRLLVQLTGTAYRVRAKAFQTELERNSRLRQAAARNTDIGFATAVQIAACHNAHTLIERCARWLLMTSDQVSASSFYLTQNYLAQMLGVRRTGVSNAAAELQRRGLVTYRRGWMAILNKAGLAAVACGCYDFIRDATRTGAGRG